MTIRWTIYIPEFSSLSLTRKWMTYPFFVSLSTTVICCSRIPVGMAPSTKASPDVPSAIPVLGCDVSITTVCGVLLECEVLGIWTTGAVMVRILWWSFAWAPIICEDTVRGDPCWLWWVAGGFISDAANRAPLDGDSTGRCCCCCWYCVCGTSALVGNCMSGGMMAKVREAGDAAWYGNRWESTGWTACWEWICCCKTELLDQCCELCGTCESFKKDECWGAAAWIVWEAWSDEPRSGSAGSEPTRCVNEGSACWKCFCLESWNTSSGLPSPERVMKW